MVVAVLCGEVAGGAETMDTKLACCNLEGCSASEVRTGLVGDPAALRGYTWLGGEPVGWDVVFLL